MSKENLRVAVVGLGKMGLLHASILNTFPNVELKALCDKGSLIRKFCKKVFKNVRVVDDLTKLSDLELDIVYAATPIPSHFGVLNTVYSNKIARNVFTEKTLASSYDESKKLCELAQKFGGVNMVGYMKRFAVTFNKAKDLMAEEALGEVVSFDAYAYSSDFFGTEQSSIESGAIQLSYGYFITSHLQIGAAPQLMIYQGFGGGTNYIFSASAFFNYNFATSSKIIPYVSGQWYQDEFAPEYGDFLDYSYINLGFGIRNFFTEFAEMLINFGYVHILGRKAETQTRDGSISPSSEEELKKNLKTFRIYSILYPFMWLFTRLDHLLFFQRGYTLLLKAIKQ